MTLKTIIEQFPPLSVDELVTEINNFPQYNIAMKKEFLAKLIKHHPLEELLFLLGNIQE